MEIRREEMVSNLSVGERRRNGCQQRYLSCKHSFLGNLKGTPESFIVNFHNCFSSGDTAALLERPRYEKWFRLSNISLIMFRTLQNENERRLGKQLCRKFPDW